MKRNILMVAACAAILFTACKTTEANYRSAYEKAKTKGESTAVDKEVYDRIRDEEGPAIMMFDGIGLPSRGLYLSPVELDSITGSIGKFNIATGRFKQTFNAKSMARRLRDNSYTNAFVAKDREGYYYVIAATADSASEASEILNSVKKKGNGSVAPFPYIIIK